MPVTSTASGISPNDETAAVMTVSATPSNVTPNPISRHHMRVRSGRTRYQPLVTTSSYNAFFTPASSDVNLYLRSESFTSGPVANSASYSSCSYGSSAPFPPSVRTSS